MNPPSRLQSQESLEPLLDLNRLAAGIRWRRRVWLSLALVGVVLGAALAVLLPSSSTATTRLYVVHADNSSGTGQDQMKTDIAIIETSTIAEAALARIQSADPPVRFLATYAATSDAPGILDITVRGRDSADAVARAQALADAFIADHVARAQSAADALVTALNDQKAAAQKALDALGAPGGPSAPAPQAGDERLALQARIGDLEGRAQDASIGYPQVAAGTRILDAPHAVNRSTLASLVINGGIGLILGLGLGLVFAAVASVVSDRPVLRRDIAAHLGASVVAQIPGRRGLVRSLLARRAPERERIVAQLARLVRSAPDGMSVLDIGCTDAAAELVVGVGSVLAAEHPVTIVDDLPGKGIAKRLDAVAGEDLAITVVDGSSLAELVDPGDGSTSARIGAASLVPGTAWLDLPRLGPETLLVVRVGSAGTEWLHTVARQLADLDISVIGIVLVHPDPRDRTDGTLWDGLHHALRGRATSGPAVASPPARTPGLDDATVAAPGEEPAAERNGTEAAVVLAPAVGSTVEAPVSNGDHPGVVTVDAPTVAFPAIVRNGVEAPSVGPDSPTVALPVVTRSVEPAPEGGGRNGAGSAVTLAKKQCLADEQPDPAPVADESDLTTAGSRSNGRRRSGPFRRSKKHHPIGTEENS